MSSRSAIYKFSGWIVVVALIFSAVGFVMAQDDDARPALGIRYDEAENGVVVVHVYDDSPAAEAGLQEGDIITAANGDTVDAETLPDVVQNSAIGDTITLTVERDGETLDIDVTLAAFDFPATAVRVPRINRADMLGLSIEDGRVTIEQLSEDNPLYEAGLREGDVITAINGESLDVPFNLRQFDGDVTLTVERDGETMDITIAAEALRGLLMFSIEGRFGDRGGIQVIPGQRGRGPSNIPGFGGQTARLGVEFRTLDEQSAQELDSDLTEGAYIIAVVPDSPAANAGLDAGDVVVAVDGDVVDSERTLSDRIYAYEPGDVITLDVVRDGETIQLEVTLGFANESAFGDFGRGFGFGFGAPTTPAEPAVPSGPGA